MTPAAEIQTIDRPGLAEAFRVNVEAGFKTILFHVHDDDRVMERLEVALTIARAFEAHLDCLHVTPIEAYSIVDTFGGTFVSSDIVDALEEEADKLRVRIEGRLRKEDISWNYEEVTGELMPRLIQRASLSDLVISAREPRQREFSAAAVTMLGDFLAEARTPLLIIGDAESDFDPFGPAVIAWNGSYEAANAARAALPLLRMASNVSVVAFSEEEEGLFPSTELVQYLSRHGIAAELEIDPVPAAALDIALIETAVRKRASYMVMGGYSHSRAGEFLFGGVTRALLKNCPVPLIVAH